MLLISLTTPEFLSIAQMVLSQELPIHCQDLHAPSSASQSWEEPELELLPRPPRNSILMPNGKRPLSAKRWKDLPREDNWPIMRDSKLWSREAKDLTWSKDLPLSSWAKSQPVKERLHQLLQPRVVKPRERRKQRSEDEMIVCTTISSKQVVIHIKPQVKFARTNAQMNARNVNFTAKNRHA